MKHPRRDHSQQHKITPHLAEHLVQSGEAAQARQLLEKALVDYHYQPRRSWAERRWAGRAKQMLKQIA